MTYLPKSSKIQSGRNDGNGRSDTVTEEKFLRLFCGNDHRIHHAQPLLREFLCRKPAESVAEPKQIARVILVHGMICIDERHLCLRCYFSCRAERAELALGMHDVRLPFQNFAQHGSGKPHAETDGGCDKRIQSDGRKIPDALFTALFLLLQGEDADFMAALRQSLSQVDRGCDHTVDGG